MQTLRVGVAGLGTVGAGVLRLLRDNAAVIAERAGRPIGVVAVSARDRARDRGVNLDGVRWHDDPVALARDPGLDAVVELIGGAGDPALALVEVALSHGLPVITANKALLARHGARLEGRLGFEAAVAGGVPAIKALREGLAANRLRRVAGILNGTCNYILSAMAQRGRSLPEVLAEAQRLGFAEADPSADIDGWDTAHKIAVLAALAFGTPIDFDRIAVEGIRHVGAADLAAARELGFRVRLLGMARRARPGVECWVAPCLVPDWSALARVEGVENAVLLEGDFVGRVLLQGRGAGAGPTASAVVADLIDLARERAAPRWHGAPVPPASAGPAAHYLRLMVTDRPGVVADVAAALRDSGVSLETVLQRGRAPDEAVPVVLVTHAVEAAAIHDALAAIERLESVVERPRLLRIEHV